MSLIAGWSQELRRRLSSNSTLLQTRQGLQELAVEGRGSLWVIARSCCVFRSFDVPNVPQSRINQVVAAQIPLLSPFKNPGHWFCIQNDQAKIWIWDEEVRAQLAERENVQLDDFNAVPETCLTLKQTDGSRLCEGSDGIFGLLWRRGELISTLR